MKHIVQSACPLDCPDRCSFQVEVEDQKVVKVSGTTANPVTAGFACSKAQHQLTRQNSADRVTKPLLKNKGTWQPIEWGAAYSLIKEKLTATLAEYGPKAILHISGAGAEGILQNFDKRFFNILGGVTKPSGCVCWGSGWRAQELDFGGVYCHSWQDLINAQTILLWGRDPMVTNQHLVPFIKKAKDNGAKVVVINPLRVDSVALADYHVAPKPGTDGALAMAMAYVLMDERALDFEFIANYVQGFQEFAQQVKHCSPQWAEGITGVPAETIKQIALLYARNKPSSILLGYGLQRYANGGQTIRTINTLAAITGNIGIAGGGVNYGHQYWRKLIKSLSGQEFAQSVRHIPYAHLATEIFNTSEPPIKALFVSKLNPVNQLPNSNMVKQAFRTIDFKVVLDFFLNDTAEEADLFLPIASSFEQTDIMVSSWNEYAVYSEQAVPPRGQAKTELEIFSRLAEDFGFLDAFGNKSREEWLQLAIEQLLEFGIDLDTFKIGPVRCPIFSEVPWQERKFDTPSGKFEILSLAAEAEMGDSLPGFGSLGPLGDTELGKEYPLHLLTPHPKFSLHSSFYSAEIQQNLPNHPQLLLHPEEAALRYLANGDKTIVETPEGQLVTLVQIDNGVLPGVAVILEGSWIKDGGGVNQLVSGVQADLGGGTAYYDCRCQVRKYNIDSLT